MDLKPNKEKLNIAVFFLAAFYICAKGNDFLTQRSNIAVAEYIYTLGGDIESHSRELERLYGQVYSDTTNLPQSQQGQVRSITFRYIAIKGLIAFIFSYYAACVVLHRLRKQEPTSDT